MHKISDVWSDLARPLPDFGLLVRAYEPIHARAADWDESEHPRDERGRFTESGGDGAGALDTFQEDGGGGAERKHPGEGYSKDAWVDSKGVIHTSNVDDAARALFEN